MAAPSVTTVSHNHESDHDKLSLSPPPLDRAMSTPLPESPDTDVPPTPSQTLTPLRAHYLKKTLVGLQFSRELKYLTTPPSNASISPLSYLGAPFTAPPKGAPYVDLPFLKFAFRQFVLTFPFLSGAPRDFFPQKVQPFVTSLLSRNFDLGEDGSEDAEMAARHKMFHKIEKHLGLILGSATKLVEKEEVVRLTQKDLDRLEHLARKRRARAQRRDEGIFDVNVICVRTVTEKHRVRSKVHEEFIVRTRRPHQPDVCVSRRYGDFKTLANELRKGHPDELVPHPPAKDRTKVSVPTSASSIRSTFSQPGQDASFEPDSSSIPPSPSVLSLNSARLAREKNRLTLRSYLHSLLATPALASSPILRSFLLSGPTTLTPEEEEDAKRREEADRTREDGRTRFAKEVAARVDALRGAAKNVKGDMMGAGGLSKVFATIKATPNIRDLPPDYKAVLEWARISLASTIFQNFVASDSSSETLAGLKRIHGLMPYFVLKGILKISNPVAMIRGVLELFLAQPFGGRSLLQRMFTSSIAEEVKALQEDIEAVKDKVDDPVMCEKVRIYVHAPSAIQAVYKADAAEEGLNLLTVILRSGDHPSLNRTQMHRVMRASRAHAEYLKHKGEDSDDDDGPQDEDAWLYEDLTVLSKLYARLRDREQLMELIFEGTTAELLKDIITIFYAPLAQVYKAANIADSLGDLQNFVNDLIRTVEQVEELSQENPQRTVQTFIDLVQRHEQAFYSFVHKVHSKGEGLFDNLMHWIELFLTLIREGLGDPISLEYLLPHMGPERHEILREVDAVALYHYRLKLAHEDKLRRRFGKPNNEIDTGEEDIAQTLVDGVVRDLSFGDLVRGEADEIAAEETDSSESESSEDDSEEETSSEGETSSREYNSSSEESTPLPPQPRTAPLPQHHHHHHDRTPARPAPSREPPRPKASLDLPAPRHIIRPTRSFTLPHPTPSSSGQFRPPPVPPLPKGISASSYSKPLPPPPPGEERPVMNGIPQGRRPSGNVKNLTINTPPRLSTPSGRKKRKGPIQITPPELKAIPELLPLFLEMMRPQLRPRPL